DVHVALHLPGRRCESSPLLRVGAAGEGRIRDPQRGEHQRPLRDDDPSLVPELDQEPRARDQGVRRTLVPAVAPLPRLVRVHRRAGARRLPADRLAQEPPGVRSVPLRGPAAGQRSRHGVAASEDVTRLLWTRSGARRIPPTRALDAALGRLRKGELFRICEFDPRGPLYLLPTRELVRALAARIRACGARRILEVAAGDGFLSAALRPALRGTRIVASDSGAWADPRARMTAGERREFRGVSVPGVRLGGCVLRFDALAAIRRMRPELVLVSWLPPGRLLERLIRAPVLYILEIGANGGVTPGAWSWRFAHELCEEVER